MSALAKKLRFDSQKRNAIFNAPAIFETVKDLGAPDQLLTDQLTGKYDWLIVFVHNVAELESFAAKVASALNPNGLLWFAFPKKSSKLKTDLSRDEGWNALESLPFRFISLISLDETWSAFAVALGAEKDAEKREKQSQARLDMLAEFIDHNTRTITLPHDLQAALNASPAEKARFEALSFTNRKEYVEWVISAKRPETRLQRIAKSIEYLAEGRKNPAGR